MTSFLYLSRADIEPLFDMGQILKYTEEAYSLYGKWEAGKNVASFSPMVSFRTKTPHSDVDYRAGSIDPIPSVCTTLGYGYWENPSKHGLPSVFAYAVLTDVATGRPLAIMEGYHVSAGRTGAAGAVASKYLARRNPRVLGFVGSGSVARYMLWAHIVQYGGFDEVRAWSRSKSRSEQFAKEMRTRFGVTVRSVATPREAADGADIVCCCTPAREPILMDEHVGQGLHINAFGADAAGKQELDPKILKRAKIVVDSLEQCKIGGEINKPLREGIISEKDVYGSIGEIVNGWKKGRSSDQEITVMDSTGLSALDVVCFHRIYEAALSKGVGTKLNL